MISESNISNIYFIGIGGIGMSAIARYFNSRGVKVSGYDKTESDLTRKLVNEGMIIHYTDDVALIDKDADLVVYTPAVPNTHSELNYFRSKGYEILKRSDVLQIITEGKFNICIAGTHGKTTISTMIAHILRESGFTCTAFLGGIAVNYQTNFWGGDNRVVVVEADEYDRSFLKLSPDVAVISAIDADHLDIYGTEEAVQDAFIQFSEKIKDKGLLINKFGIKRSADLQAPQKQQYSLQNDSADVYADNIRITKGSYIFDVLDKDGVLENIRLNVGGMHNVENAIAAISIARYLKIDDQKIIDAVGNFKGVKRRFEYIIPFQNNHVVYIDDYAHHPEELKALLTSAKALFADRRIMVIFQPHLYSRTKDLAEEFGESLQIADTVALLPLYPARELPIPGVDSKLIYDNINKEQKYLLSKEQLLEYLNKLIPDELQMLVVITAGAGDIDQLIEPIKSILNRN